jgi:hypothetical protein
MAAKSVPVKTDWDYHSKQIDPKKSVKEEIKAIRQSMSAEVEAQAQNMVNSLGNDTREIMYMINEKADYYRNNFGRFGNDVSLDTYAISRDPILGKAQQMFESHMRREAINAHGTGFFTNSYQGYGSSAHFMIRALSYIYPMLIIKPLAKLTFREDWPILTGNQWAQFDVFLTAERVYNATLVDDQATESGRVNANFGEAVFPIITLRQDIVWDSTVELYADQTLNGGLLNYIYFESCKRGFDEKINDLYLFGDTTYAMPGLFSNLTSSNIYGINIINSSGTWAAVNATSGEKNSTTDLIRLVNQVEQQSNGVYNANHIMMSLKTKPLVVQPRSQYVSTSPMGFVAGQKWGNDFESVLENVRYNPYLNDKGTAVSAGASQLAIAYDKNETFAHIGLPTFMFIEPITYESHKFKIPFLTRTGGFRVIQSPSMAIMDQISIA